MTRRYLWISNIVTTFLLVFGFIFIIFIDSKSYYNYVKDNTEQLSQLTALSASNEITESINQLADVSHSMSCNDFFIKRLMNRDSYNYKEDLQQYLSQFYSEYDFDTVFLVSAMTGNYYTQNGVVKQVSINDEHDIWFYQFLDSGKDFDIELDKDQFNQDQLTLFVNYRIKDPDGKTLGIIGVGKRFDEFKSKAQEYMDQYQLSIYVINKGSALNSYHNDSDFFISEQELANRLKLNDYTISDQGDHLTAKWFTFGKKQVCMYFRFEQKFQWEVVILKEQDTFYNIFYHRLVKSFGMFLFISIFFAAIINIILAWKDKRVILRENTDELTGLYNRKMFSQIACNNYSHYYGRVLFMMDVDNFKNVNDTEGHLFGNNILQVIGEELRNNISNRGIVGRWGGDEFIGILDMDEKSAVVLLTQLMDQVAERTKRMDYPITLSIGVTQISNKTLEKDMRAADEQLYCAKKSGKSKISFNRV